MQLNLLLSLNRGCGTAVIRTLQIANGAALFWACTVLKAIAGLITEHAQTEHVAWMMTNLRHSKALNRN